MNRAALVVGLGLLAPTVARAEPTVTLTGCAFTPPALAAALAREAVDVVRVQVVCRPDGTATLTLPSIDGARWRDVDLRDVPATLAPRVVALVAATLAREPMPEPDSDPDPDPDSDPDPDPDPDPDSDPDPDPDSDSDSVTDPVSAAPAMLAPSGPGAARPSDTTAPVPARTRSTHRAALLDSARDRRLALVGRALLRRYHDVPLAGAGAAVARGPFALGLHAAAGRVEHRLGTATPWLVGVDVAATLACARARPVTCLGARVEISRQEVTAASSDPAVMATALSTLAVHGSAELSFTIAVGGTDVSAVAALGLGSGLVARANASELVALAGWTLGGALEVRR